MGTSSSSSGSPSGAPMVPPWVPDPVTPLQGGGTGGDEGGNNDEASPDAPKMPPPSAPAPVAPAGRFGPARLNLGRFARSGSEQDMRRGVAHYVRKGLGGSGTGIRRLGGTVQTAGKLFGALSGVAGGQAQTAESPLDPAILSGRSADEVLDAVVEAVRPVDGTQDGEASRDAISRALSDLLNQFPEADLLDLSEEQRLFAVERFIAFDVFNRFELDLGKSIQEKAPTASAALARLKEVRDYIAQTIAAVFRKRSSTSKELGARSVATIVRECLREAFDVFGSYLS